jgi:hypothetical protein
VQRPHQRRRRLAQIGVALPGGALHLDQRQQLLGFLDEDREQVGIDLIDLVDVGLELGIGLARG